MKIKNKAVCAGHSPLFIVFLWVEGAQTAHRMQPDENEPLDDYPRVPRLLLSITGHVMGALRYTDSTDRYHLEVKSEYFGDFVERSATAFPGNGVDLKTALGRQIPLQPTLQAIDLPSVCVSTEISHGLERRLVHARHLTKRVMLIRSPPDNVLVFTVSDTASAVVEVSHHIETLVIYADNRSHVLVTVLPRVPGRRSLSVCLIATRESVIRMKERSAVTEVSPCVIFSGQVSSVSGFFPTGLATANRVYTKDSGIVAFTAADGTPYRPHDDLAHTQFKWCDTEWRVKSIQRMDPYHLLQRPAGDILSLHRDLVRRVLNVPVSMVQPYPGDGARAEEDDAMARAVAASLREAPATGRKKVLQAPVERPIMFLRPDPGSDEEGRGVPSTPEKKRKMKNQTVGAPEKAPVKAGEECVICLTNEKTHWSVGCAHLLYCDHCVHKVAAGNEWKVCPLCNTPSRGITFRPL